ncbi:hypothetical protein EMPG_12681 [Blastomyces silverae]|uniref:No apical meristem-associated C-terminal domain-containing protein n=1 Tax=Blastomyces silverae TaxID=2060906 RepID=A0A0H1BL32_9EURO|nr:hypothetical protein EMPG_12681 [Blastomyces silverae]
MKPFPEYDKSEFEGSEQDEYKKENMKNREIQHLSIAHNLERDKHKNMIERQKILKIELKLELIRAHREREYDLYNSDSHVSKAIAQFKENTKNIIKSNTLNDTFNYIS